MNSRVLVAILTVTFLTSVVHAQNYRWNASFQTYIDQYRDLAIQEMLRYNIPASNT